MKMLWKYVLKYKGQFIARIVTVSLVAIASICFDFMMGFIVDIFSSGRNRKVLPILIMTYFTYIHIVLSRVHRWISYVYLCKKYCKLFKRQIYLLK